MKFERKLIVREGQYASISVPKPVLDVWTSVDDVEILFNEFQNIMIIIPQENSDLQ